MSNGRVLQLQQDRYIEAFPLPWSASLLHVVMQWERVCCRTLHSSTVPSRCWSNRSPGQTFSVALSDFSGTRCYKQFWSATLFYF